MVASLTLPPQLFAAYETAWALGAKLAAVNALSAFEVAAWIGVPAGQAQPLLQVRPPRSALTLGRSVGLPYLRIEQAFLGGALQCLHSLVSEYLRRCPICVRLGYHFIVHQLRVLSTCPLHHVPLREHCSRCATHLPYDLGASKVQGPITCPECAAPLLPVTRGGFPTTVAITGREFGLLERWMAFLRRRAALPAWRNGSVVIDTSRYALTASGHERLSAILPAGSVCRTLTCQRACWCDDWEHRALAQRYWQHANALWRQCDPPSRRWCRCLLKGDATKTAPNAHVLAFLYWRMTWQGCSNPYLLRRGHGLPLYGIAEWQAGQPAPDNDDLDAELLAFSDAMEASWREWLDCIDLLGVTTLERRTWRLRAVPSAYL